MTRGYVYDQGFAEERRRLAGMESLWDPGSQALLDEIGVYKGWRCLEVGAGGGSLVEWMIGRGATVMAIDIDTRFIESLASDAVEVPHHHGCERPGPRRHGTRGDKAWAQ
jgi:2-polyprenyl-3-methyl-5-hydroxy-6-metoxy-1,4-benzoquinol methylase